MERTVSHTNLNMHPHEEKVIHDLKPWITATQHVNGTFL